MGVAGADGTTCNRARLRHALAGDTPRHQLPDPLDGSRFRSRSNFAYLVGQGRRLAMISIAWTEFLCGPLQAGDVETAAMVVTERIPYDDLDADLAAEAFNGTGRRRGSLIDCIIGAATVRRGAVLASMDSDDFRRFEPLGFRIADLTAA